MHVPDHILSPETCSVTLAVSCGTLAYAFRQMNTKTKGTTLSRSAEEAPSLFGIRTLPAVAAFIFAAQMVNFPVAGGTSGHLLGGALAGILLGPWAGLVAMTAVLAVQAALFQDGGLLALGANVLNMGIAGAVGGAWIYQKLSQIFTTRWGKACAAGCAGWLTAQLGALLCALELAASGQFPLSSTIESMLSIHVVIGVVEGVITAGIVGWVLQFQSATHTAQTNPLPVLDSRKAAWKIIAAAMMIALLVAPWASPLPDGLEAAMMTLGVDLTSLPATHLSPLADYEIRGASPWLAVPVVGIVGVLSVLLVSCGLGLLTIRGNRQQSA